jgi:NADPH2:quinone reductase
MKHAIRVHRPGGPGALVWEPVTVGAPGPTELRIRQTVIGVNFIDIYHRTGLYPLPTPFIPGFEATGVVEAVGSAVTAFSPGDRVVYTGVPGAYAEERLLEERQAIALPADIPDRVAAAVFVRGLTVDFLLSHVYPVQAGQTVLIHAAAGGVGLLFSQWAAARGAEVIGVVSTEAKAQLARRNGCHHVILSGQEDLVARVSEITGGRKLPVVYDSVGRDTFQRSLECLQPLGLLVSFGNASGPVPPLEISKLAAMGSLKVTRCTIATATARPALYQQLADSLFAMLRAGKLDPNINQAWPLAEAAAAQIALESRATTGSTILEVTPAASLSSQEP